MSLDASLLGLALNNPSLLNQLRQQGITDEHFVGQYQKVWRWITHMKKKHGNAPSFEVTAGRFDDLDFFPARKKDLPFLLSDLQKRKKYRDFQAALDEASMIAMSPDELDEAIAVIQSRVNELVIRDGESNIVDLFGEKTRRRMVREIKKRRSGLAQGLPTGLRRFDAITGGLHRKEMYVIMGRPGLGKAQPLDAKILTPSGWSTMGQMQVGSEVLCPDGAKAKVVQVHPQGRKEIFRVTFSDGGSTEVTGDHLWKTQTRNERRRNVWSVKITAEIASSLRHDDHWNHYVPLIEPLKGESIDLPIDPYVVGALLGDGHVRTRGNTTEVLLTSGDPELVEEVNSLLPVGSFTPNKKLCYRFVDESTYWYKASTLRQNLRDLGMGSGYSYEKKIPEIYMRASMESRLSLLQGLLDTDGEASARTSAVYCSTSRVMTEQAREIVWSLGGVATWDERITYYDDSLGEKKAGRTSYRLRITLPEGVRYFRLDRKQSQIADSVQKRGRAVRTIRSVEKVRRAEARCITIDHPEHLYVTDDYAVTHNSWLDLLFTASAVLNGQKVLLYPLEMTLEMTALRLYTLFSQKMYGGQKVFRNTDLARGAVTKAKIIKFLHILEDKFEGQLLVADIGNMSDAYTVERIDAEVEAHQPDMFWVDYITLMKAPGVGRDGGEDHTTIKALSNGIKHIAVRHNTVGGVSAQVNREAIKGRQFLPRVENIAYGDAIGQDATGVVSINKKGPHLYYALVKHRHGPEVGRTRVKWFVDEGLIEETSDQEDDDED